MIFFLVAGTYTPIALVVLVVSGLLIRSCVIARGIRADLAHAFRPQDVMRWEGILRVTEKTQGTDWYLGHTWYHLLPNGSALSLLTFADGETRRPVELKDAGFQLTWRRPFTRDWIYLSLGPSLTWPRRQPEDERKANLGFGVWIEMEFGDWRY